MQLATSSFDVDGLDNMFADDDDSIPPLPEESVHEESDITKLQDKVKEQEKRIRQLEEENSASLASLQSILHNVVVALRKNEEGYEFENTKYFRIMSVLHRPYPSVRELVANLLVCFVKINRKGGDYGERERQPKRGRGEE